MACRAASVSLARGTGRRWSKKMTSGDNRHRVADSPKPSKRNWFFAALILALGIGGIGYAVNMWSGREAAAPATRNEVATASAIPEPEPTPAPAAAAAAAEPAGAPLRSTLVPVALPPGTIRAESKTPGAEMWKVPEPYVETVLAVRSQLPVNEELEGLAWCGKTAKVADFVEWSWGTQDDLLVVTVTNQDQLTQVDVRRGQDPAGC
jgi:hypothetical protein